VTIQRKTPQGGTWIGQTQYILDTIDTFKDEIGVNVRTTPLDRAPEVEKTPVDPERVSLYRSVVGKIGYLARWTRPDLAVAFSVLGRHQETPSEGAFDLAARVLGYMWYTRESGLFLNHKNTERPITIYTDSDWAADKQGRRSQTGYISFVLGGAVSWNSVKQHSVALSTMEAEFMAASEAVKEGMHLRKIAMDLELQIGDQSVLVLCDNQPALQALERPACHSKAKHIDIRYNFVREAIVDGTVDARYVPTDRNLADPLTKGLGKTLLHRLVSSWGIGSRGRVIV